MSKKLFVGNLAWNTTEDELKTHFEQCGKVTSARIVTDRSTGRSKGFGFVEMENAEAAIRELNEKPLLDRNLRVSLAQERQDRPARTGDRPEGRRDFRGGSGSSEYSGGGRSDFNRRKSY